MPPFQFGKIPIATYAKLAYTSSVKLTDLEPRLLRLAAHRMTQTALASRLHCSQSKVSRLLAGEIRLHWRDAQRLMEALGLTIRDLVESSPSPPTTDLPDSPFVQVPLLRGAVAAGQPLPIENEPESWRAFLGSYIRRFSRPILLRVGKRETSMLPTVCPGDLVLVDRDEEKRRRPSLHHIYAVSLDEGGTLKRCKLEGDHLLVIPDNPTAGFDPTTVSLKGRDILQIIQGQVVWVGRELG